MAAKSKKSPLPDSYYADMQAAKVASGLTLQEAIEVTARQRAEDLANDAPAADATDTPPEA